MDYTNKIFEEDSSSMVSEPVMVACVAQTPINMMNREELKQYCRDHVPSDFLKELEENNFYLDSDIPLDSLPQSADEWMRMADEAEASGWLTEAEFHKHASEWSHL